jgi:uncharacterized RDD family membrane protein YckC
MNSYQISRGGQALGEFVESQILEGLQTGYFQPTDWCWREGMADWQGLGTLFLQVAPQPRHVPTTVNPYSPPRASTARRTPSATPSRFAQKASPGSRLAAYILDIIVLSACFLPAGFVSDSAAAKNDMTMVYISLCFVGILWITNLILLATDGQTVGKRLMGIRIAQIEDSTKAGFMQIVLLRTFLGKWVLNLIPLYGLVDVLFIFSEDQRCLHDKVGGTHVVKVE